MKNLRTFALWLGIFAGVFCEGSEYEELRYEDLVQQLSEKRDSPRKKSTSSEVMMHAGFGFVSSANQIRYPNEVRSRPLSGFQISTGVDLFSEQWLGEFLFRNFANHHSGSETRALRETDWRVVYRNPLSSKIESRFGAGFGSRTFNLSDDSSGYAFSQSTTVGLISAGFETLMGRYASLGLEVGIRSALIVQTNDVNAIDLTMRVESRF